MRIAVVTSYHAAEEPRAPRHAVAARLAFPDAEIVLIDAAPEGKPPRPDPPILQGHSIRRHTIQFPTRRQPVVLAARRMATKLGQLRFVAARTITEAAFGVRMHGLGAALAEIRPTLCIAHNLDTLYPTASFAKRHRKLIFDCMEFYADMGDGQSSVERAMADAVQELCLPRCALVLSTSVQLSAALAKAYKIEPPLPSYNVPPLHYPKSLPRSSVLRLYWRNSVIGFGQRGLDDALVALGLLPESVQLTVQGRLAPDGGEALRLRISELNLADRVRILPPYATGMAVEAASQYDIGLCLERAGPRNHELTVSNKMFDYHMAGLAVVSSDLPSLRDVVRRSGGGLLYRPGDPRSLANAIQVLLKESGMLAAMKTRARGFAETEANLEVELKRLSVAFRGVMSAPGEKIK